MKTAGVLALAVMTAVALMKTNLRNWRRRFEAMSLLLLVTMLVSASCSSRGPVPVEGVATGKHEVTSKSTPRESLGKEKPRYFLWVKTEDGLALVEVTESVFQSVVEGDRVCINCKGHPVVSKAAAAEVPPRPVFVERDFVSVYSQMATTSDVVFTLMRGNLVEIDFVVTSTEEAWCRIKEVASGGRSGFVLCEWLGAQWPPTPAPPTVTGRPQEEAPPVVAEPPEATQARPQPPRVPPVAEKPAPKPMARVPEPEVEREKQYSVQVATLVVERNARILKKRLEKLGYTPVIRMTTAPITRHRVYGGSSAVARRRSEPRAD